MRSFFLFLTAALLVLGCFLGFYLFSSVLFKNNLMLNYALHLVLLGSIIAQNPKRLISNSLTLNFGTTLGTVLIFYMGQRLMLEGFTAMLAPLPGWQLWVEEYNTLFQQISPVELMNNILVLGPIREEVFFRWMYGKLTQNQQSAPQFGKILFSTLAFTLIHPPAAWVNAFIWGWGLMLFYLNTQSLVFVIVLHSLANALAYVFPLSSHLKSDTDLSNIFWNFLWLTIGFFLVFFSLKRVYKTIRKV